jgi:hypothetical protein
MSTNHTPNASRTVPAIVPVRPVTAAEDAAAPRTGRGLLRRTLGKGHPSRRTFGRGNPSRRTFGRGNPSRRTFGRGNPSRRTFGRNLP